MRSIVSPDVLSCSFSRLPADGSAPRTGTQSFTPLQHPPKPLFQNIRAHVSAPCLPIYVRMGARAQFPPHECCPSCFLHLNQSAALSRPSVEPVSACQRLTQIEPLIRWGNAGPTPEEAHRDKRWRRWGVRVEVGGWGGVLGNKRS